MFSPSSSLFILVLLLLVIVKINGEVLPAQDDVADNDGGGAANPDFALAIERRAQRPLLLAGPTGRWGDKTLTNETRGLS